MDHLYRHYRTDTIAVTEIDRNTFKAEGDMNEQIVARFLGYYKLDKFSELRLNVALDFISNMSYESLPNIEKEYLSLYGSQASQ